MLKSHYKSNCPLSPLEFHDTSTFCLPVGGFDLEKRIGQQKSESVCTYFRARIHGVVSSSRNSTLVGIVGAWPW